MRVPVSSTAERGTTIDSARRGADKAGADKHAGQQSHARVGYMHMHGNGARLGVCLRLDEVDMPVQRAVGQRLGSDLHFLPAADLRQLILIDVGLDPDLAEVGDRE